MESSEAVYAVYPVFARTRSLDEVGADFAEDQTVQLSRILEKYADRVSVRGVYTTTGFRPGTDLMFWWVTRSFDDVQQLLVELRRTQLGRSLELTHSFIGVVRPAEFNPDHLPAFLRGEEPRKYLSVYPFVRTEDWYLMEPARRGKLLAEHGRMGREFPQVLPNTTSAFGIGDWEWILAFEADDLTHIVDCIRRLREAEARRYTKLDTPFVVGTRTDVRGAIESLI